MKDKKYDGFAIASFIMSLFVFLSSIVLIYFIIVGNLLFTVITFGFLSFLAFPISVISIIFGITSLVRIRKNKNSKARIVSIVSLITSIVALIVYCIILFLLSAQQANGNLMNFFDSSLTIILNT